MSSADPAVDSRWWYLIAGVAIWTVLSLALFLGYLVADQVGTPLALLAYGGFFLPALLPVALYLDGKRVRAAGVDWNPNLVVYVGAGLVGLALPVVGLIAAGWYLYRRHLVVGVP